MKIFKTGIHNWENKHETFVEPIQDLYEIANEPAMGALEGYNDSTKGFQNLIKEAIASDTPLRSLGAGWSWTKIATVTNGLMLDTKPLNTTINISSKSVVDAYKGNPEKLIFAQCGNAVWELSRELRHKNLSLKASGASNGQTIAGVIATGAHGSSIDFGSVQEFVVGLHIINGANKHIYVERKSYPVVNNAFITKLGTQLVQDDDLFNSAVVSMGCFGVVHGVMVETEDLFLLECYMRRMPYDDTLKKLMRTLDFTNSQLPHGSERPFHFAVSINPYDMVHGAYVYSFYKRPYRDNYNKKIDDDNAAGPGDDAACFIGKLTQVVPKLVPVVVNKLLAGALKPFEKIEGTLGEIFNNTSLHGKLLSAAIGVSIDDINKVIDLLLELNKTKGPFLGLFAFRFIKKTNATLGFTKFDHTCVFELDGAFSPKTSKFFKDAWAALEAAGIPFTMHWGKVNELNFTRLQKMYGANLDTWLRARKEILDTETMKVFNNAIMQQWGLDKVLV
jgi:FAD/FMN-containing dehydrogenase